MMDILHKSLTIAILAASVFISGLNIPLSALAEKAPNIDLTPEEQAWLAEHPEIILGTTTEYAPMVIKRADGTHVGMLVDIYEQVNRHLNTSIRLHIEDPWAAVQQKAQNREIDGLALGGKEPSRDALYNATNVIVPTYFSVFARSQNEFRIKRFSDLAGMRIGYKRAARPTRSLLEKLQSADLKPYDSHESMTQALLSKEIDVIVAWMSYDHWRKEKLQGTIDNILLIDEYPIEMVTHIRKDWPELIPILNKTIAALQHEELPRITNKWFGLWPQQSKAASIPLTSEEQAWLKKGYTVRARVTYWPPYQFKEPEASGICIDYLKVISKRLGIKIKFIPDTIGFAASIQDFLGEKKHYDMFSALERTPEREEKMAFTDNYLFMPWVIFSRDDREFIGGVEDLNGKTVSVERDYAMALKLEKEYPGIRLLKVRTSLDALRVVATTKADAYIGSLANSTWLIRDHGLDNLKIVAPTPFDDHDQAVAVRSDWPELASIINKGFASLTQTEHSTIKGRWLSTIYKKEVDYTLLWQVLAGAGLVFIVIILWNTQLSRKVRDRTNELSESEARFRATFEQAAVGVAHVSTEGKFLRINRKFCDIIGYSEDEMLDLTFMDITHPDDFEFDVEHLQQVLQGTRENYSIEKRYFHKDGSIVWVNLTVSLLLDDEGSPEYFVSVIKDISDRKQVEQKIIDYQQRLKALASKLTIAEEKERRAIAADLHDHVGQSLALARIQLSSARKTASDSKLADKLDDISDTLLESLERTQNLMLELGSHSMHDTGLSAALSDWLEGEIGKRHGLETIVIDNMTQSHRKTLAPEIRTILFRNVKELVVNVVKHARANQVSVRFEDRDPSIRIIVEDDGIGFEPRAGVQEASKIGGFGLFSIEELMADLGGDLKIVSAPGKGCTAILSAPYGGDDDQVGR